MSHEYVTTCSFLLLIYKSISVTGLVRLAEYTIPYPKQLQSKPQMPREPHICYMIASICTVASNTITCSYIMFPVVDLFSLHLALSRFLAAWLRTRDIECGNKLAQAVTVLTCSEDGRCRVRISASTPAILRF